MFTLSPDWSSLFYYNSLQLKKSVCRFSQDNTCPKYSIIYQRTWCPCKQGSMVNHLPGLPSPVLQNPGCYGKSRTVISCINCWFREKKGYSTASFSMKERSPRYSCWSLYSSMFTNYLEKRVMSKMSKFASGIALKNFEKGFRRFPQHKETEQ